MMLNTWTHVAGTFDGSQIVLYINGQVAKTQAATGVLRHNDEPVYIAGSQFYTPRTLHGMMDDVRIYGFAQSPEQILAYHNTGRDLIVSQGTVVGDVWHADITPFSATDVGAMCQTNSLTILEPTASPVITSTALTTAVIDMPYSYVVDATGQPVPTYSQTTMPTGMTIDAITGVISWTPTIAQLGTNPVVVVATNTGGTANQSFGVSVVETPECLVTATSLDNSTSDSLMASYSLIGGQVTAATAWYVNGLPQMALYLPFEGGVANSMRDYSGNGNDAGATGSPTWNATTGHDGFGAMALNGASDYLVVPDNSSLDVDYVTLST